MEKYYTPELEEFCIGLNFEYLGDRDENNNRWHKSEITKSNFWTFADVEDKLHNYDSSLIRVKYLDSEDIESLGFHADKERHWEHRELYKSDNYGIEITLPSRKMIIRTIDDKKEPYHFHGYEIPKLKTIFEGDIKNKSELKRLLNQLGI